ncbi:MAG: AMP-binding protein [Gammaproteobacteria bacterium]
MLKLVLRWLFSILYQVEVCGLENYQKAGERVLIVANHISLLDPLLIAVFLPHPVTFAINTQIARKAWVKPFLLLCRVFPMDPTNPLSSKALIAYLKENRRAVIFPEGRITVTGSLMKIYDGTGLVAVKSGAAVLPIRIDGAQYTPFSRMRGRVRLRWFPKIRLSILPAVRLNPPATVEGRDRRKHAGRMLADQMTEMMFETSNYRRTIFTALLDARKVHGGRHRVLEDIHREPLSYDALIMRAFCLAYQFRRTIAPGEIVGILLPNTAATVITMFGLQCCARVPAMLNYSTGVQGMASACRTAQIKTLITSREFLKAIGLESLTEHLTEGLQVLYLEDLSAQISLVTRCKGYLRSQTARFRHDAESTRNPDSPAVVLFTSGSEGTPKGVVLSHANLLANRAQLAARVDFSSEDIILNVLPLFHSFGLTAGTLLPLLSGMRTFLYPSPLHYRVVPEISYDINATILFGTNTFLAGYARHAHPYDFYSVRYVFAGAEKLQDETRQLWSTKFGIRIFEGYGATETSPVLAANTPMDNSYGAVGRFLPGIEYRLEEVPGVADGARLHVRGPNVMLGYLLAEHPGVIRSPHSRFGEGWYDTGDIVAVDEAGFLTIRGRAKRFAKIGGEMVSLAAAEELVGRIWPAGQHAVVALPDPKKGEQLVLVTDVEEATREQLIRHAKGVGEINLPKIVIPVDSLPLTGSGKIDYPAVTRLAGQSLKTQIEEEAAGES